MATIEPRGFKLAVLVFCLVVAFSLPGRVLPLGFAGGSVDGDWFTLGANIATFGVLGFGEEPLVYRSPGFPAFVAAILKLTVDPRTHTRDAVFAIGPLAVLLAQSFLLGLSAFLLHLWLSRRLSAPTAFAAALVFGANPYSLAVASMVHYDVLNWALILLFILVLEVAFEHEGPRAFRIFALSGALLAVAALVRPVVLIAPLPLLAVFYLRLKGRDRLIGYAWLLLGFALGLLPWTARNFMVTGRLIPVNAQGWTNTFVSTVDVLGRNPDVYDWNAVARRRYLPLYRSVTGEAEITVETYARQVVKLEDAARAGSLRNLREKPHVFVANFLSAGKSFVFQVNAVLLTAFVKLQTGEPFDVRWIYAGQRSNLVRGPEARSFQWLHDLLLWSGILGIAAGVFRRDVFLAVPLAAAGAIVLAHCLTYLDFYYYAAKIPFLVAFAFYGIDRLPRAPRLASIVALVAWSLSLSWVMGFAS